MTDTNSIPDKQQPIKLDSLSNDNDNDKNSLHFPSVLVLAFKNHAPLQRNKNGNLSCP